MIYSQRGSSGLQAEERRRRHMSRWQCRRLQRQAMTATAMPQREHGRFNSSYSTLQLDTCCKDPSMVQYESNWCEAPSDGSSQKLGGGRPRAPSVGAIISNQWKNWGAWTKSEGAKDPRPQPRTATGGTHLSTRLKVWRHKCRNTQQRHLRV